MAINFNFRQTCKRLANCGDEIQSGFGKAFHYRILWLAEEGSIDTMLPSRTINMMNQFAELGDCLLLGDDDDGNNEERGDVIYHG